MIMLSGSFVAVLCENLAELSAGSRLLESNSGIFVEYQTGKNRDREMKGVCKIFRVVAGNL